MNHTPTRTSGLRALPVSFALEPEDAEAERRAWEMLHRFAAENSHGRQANEHGETTAPQAGAPRTT